MEHGMTSTPGAIEGIDGITYSTDRWDDARRFFADWGLAAVSDDPACQVWETLNGARVRVCRPDDAALPPPMEAGPTMREVVWGVADAAALDAWGPLITSELDQIGQRRGASEPDTVSILSSVTSSPAFMLSYKVGAPVGSTPTILMPGRTALAAAATPAIRPPPPIATTSVSAIGICARISSANVPCPAITCGSAKGCT